jgi:predicted ATPase
MTDEIEREAVTELVQLLDGLPLAIELAASRARVLTPRKMLGHVGDRFRLLAAAGARQDRQATLRATFDWSWDLLAEWEKASLAQLSVFRGGFTLDAAEAVLDLSAWRDAPWTMDVVHALVAKSLVHEAGMDRHDLLVSVQEYAAERLRTPGSFAGSGEGAARAARERHGQWFACLGSPEALAAADAPDGAGPRRTLALELENIVAACRRSVQVGDAGTGVALLAAAWRVFQRRGPFASALSLAGAVESLPILDPSQRLEVLQVLAHANRNAGGLEEARIHCESALALCRKLGRRRLEGRLLGNLASLLHDQGRLEEARHQYEAALAMRRETGDRVAEARVICNLGNLHHEQGRMQEAAACYEAALRIHREFGIRKSESLVLDNLGNLHRNSGRIEEARACCESALAIARETGDRRGEAIVLGNLANILRDRGRNVDARACFDAALAIVDDLGDRRSRGAFLGELGTLHAEQGREEQARACYEEAVAIHAEVSNRRFAGQVLGALGLLHAKKGRASESRAALTEGEAALRAMGDRRGGAPPR